MNSVYRVAKADIEILNKFSRKTAIAEGLSSYLSLPTIQ